MSPTLPHHVTRISIPPINNQQSQVTTQRYQEFDPLLSDFRELEYAPKLPDSNDLDLDPPSNVMLGLGYLRRHIFDIQPHPSNHCWLKLRFAFQQLLGISCLLATCQLAFRINMWAIAHWGSSRLKWAYVRKSDTDADLLSSLCFCCMRWQNWCDHNLIECISNKKQTQRICSLMFADVGWSQNKLYACTSSFATKKIIVSVRRVIETLT